LRSLSGSDIMRDKSASLRSEVLMRYLDINAVLLEIGNLHDSIAVSSGITLSCVSRMRDTLKVSRWRHVHHVYAHTC
jgi:hypothetical protein